MLICRVCRPSCRPSCRVSNPHGYWAVGYVGHKPSTFPCMRARARKTNTAPLSKIRKPISTRHTRHTRHTLIDQQLTKKVMGDTMSDIPNTHSRTIRCTPENAAQMQQVVKNWPELHALVKHLQDQNLFPGLRNLQITLTGSAETCAKGLGALLPQNAAKRD